MNGTEDLSIYIKADGAPQAASAVGDVGAALKSAGSSGAAAAAGMGTAAGAVDTLRISMTGLQKAFVWLSFINTAINWFTRLGEVSQQVVEWFQKISGMETVADRVSKITDSVNGLAAAYKSLVAQAEAWNKAGQEDTAATIRQQKAEADRQVAEIELKLQKDLAGTQDPGARDTLQRRAESDKLMVQGGYAPAAKATEIAGVVSAMEGNRKTRGEVDLQLAQAAAVNNTAAGMLARGGLGKDREKELESEQQKAATLYDEMLAKIKTLDAEYATLARTRGTLEVERSAAAVVQQAGGMADAQKTSELEQRQQQERIAGAADRRKAVASELEGFFGPIDAAAKKQDEVRDNTKKKIDAITVDAPRAATAEGSIGGIMGNQIMTGQRLREQREAARDAIMKEQTTLLAQIKEALDE